MNIGLDYDDTYTRDPATWDVVIKALRDAGHNVYCTTWRSNSMSNLIELQTALGGKVNAIFCTGQQAKSAFMFEQRIRIDVWIDDMPMAIDNHGAGYQPPVLSDLDDDNARWA